MSMFDRIKDQAKGLQQSRGGARSGSQGSTGSGGGSKAQLVSMFKSQLSSMKTELKSGAYRDATMAVCALVAAADGHVHPAERERMESMIMTNDVLQNFPPEQLRQRFTKHLDRLTVDFQSGKAEALQEIAKAKKKAAEARAVIQTGFVIAGADGHIDPAEQQVLREACSVLGLAPSEFGI
ncbi:TerB family tellurite resistance protein [Streptomyces sp. NBC_01808]|nr:TerB family tellurite resistance protein [Streptomyces sp. NBC_01808]WSA41716.1 TerB family tellurite resistance protein [Streptomyces sp. NBC_01808]